MKIPTLPSVMRKLARFQYAHYEKIVVIGLILTIILAMGLPNIRMETDFSKELPQDLDVIKLQNRVGNTFGSQDLVIVAFQLDRSNTNGQRVEDIRDPRVMQMLSDLEESIQKETEIDQTRSVASFFPGGIPENTSSVKKQLSQVQGTDDFFNRDYSATLLYAFADLGGGEDVIKEVNKKIQEDIDAANTPPGVSTRITGTPPVRATIMDLLQSDALYTMSVSAAIILVLLLIIHKPRKRGLLVFIPLIFGLVWTLGLMGWLDIPLNVATVGLGAMILGLSVEYGVFYVSRYKEERDEGVSQKESLMKVAGSAGSAISGSSTTTIVGFFALTLSTMPMMQKLGFALALGIFCSAVSALVLNPAIILLEESLSKESDSQSRLGGVASE